MGHGDSIIIADANFPSDSIAHHTKISTPIRICSSTSEILRDILKLMPLDTYSETPVEVMDRVPSDKAKDLHVPAYELISKASAIPIDKLTYVERFEFYERAKACFCVIQTDDRTLYANVIISKGVISS